MRARMFDLGVAGFLAAATASIPPASTARADEAAAPTREEFEDELPLGGSLTGREIYDRFLENRFKKSHQQLRMISRDPGGSEQTTAFTLSVEDLRDAPEPAGIRGHVLIEVSSPFDVRHTQYLMIDREPGPDDEFVYQPSERRVRRVDLKKTPMFGTDYTFDDFAYYEVEDAEYRRLQDAVVDGTPVYVIEAFIEESRDTQYHRTITYLEKDHYIPLRVRYFDDYGIEVKRLSATARSIREFGDIWVATESTMHDLFQRTSSTLLVDEIDSRPSFHEQHFTVSRLNKGN